MAVVSFPPPCLYFEIVGILCHLVLLHFLDLFSSCFIWFMWGFGDSENHAFTGCHLSRMPPSATILTHLKKIVHKQGDGCNSFSGWRTEKKTYSPILPLLDERRGKAPKILVEGPFNEKPAVLFLISFVFSN